MVQIIVEISIIVLALTSIITAIAVIIALRKRNLEPNDTKRTGKANLLPIFVFETHDSWFIDERSTDHTESIKVKNVGADIRFTKEIEVSTILDFKIMNSDYREHTRHYVEFDSFYGKNLIRFDPFTRQSEAYHSKENIVNLDVLLNAPAINGNKDILKSLKFFVTRFNLFKIEYEDLSGKQYIRYYEDNKEITKEEYTGIKTETVLHITDVYTPSDTLLDIYTPLIADRNNKLATTSTYKNNNPATLAANLV